MLLDELSNMHAEDLHIKVLANVVKSNSILDIDSQLICARVVVIQHRREGIVRTMSGHFFPCFGS